MRHWLLLTATVFLAALPRHLAARVFTTPEAAFASAFPTATMSSTRLYLTAGQRDDIQHRLGRPVHSRLYTVYLALDRSGRRTGYGFVHTEKVRSKEQTLFIAVTPEETIRSITLISFFEPEEYTPSERWLRLFQGKGTGKATGKGSAETLLPGVDIPVISGATLTTRACADSARLILMLVPLAKQAP